MIRLVLLLGPAAACGGGIALALMLGWCYERLTQEAPTPEELQAKHEAENARRVAQLERVQDGGWSQSQREAGDADDGEELPPEMSWGTVSLCERML